ncbi:factor-independent urate hydroxylase [Micromonospora sp. NPDC051543]|uniref:factor-independent urate hydroxylase n=1 Tax=Micromonospora sp. NPDC051543 TaxID=3364287 RepID=UPI00378C0B84
MDVVLGPHQYGKAEVRLVHVVRHGERHDLTDLTVGVALAGDLADTHLTGDNSKVLPTDSQKNTVYAFARRHGVGAIEDFGLRLARHFVESQPAITRATVDIHEHAWGRLGPHSFARSGTETRTATVTVDGSDAVVVSGLTGMVLMNTTDSEFFGFVRDAYTTLPEAHDRILATAVDARWRHATSGSDDWAVSFGEVRRHLVEAFVDTHSLSLQQTLHAMGQRVLEHRPEITEVRMSLPNKHHFLVDLAPFGLDNPNEVFHAPDRPYGLIEGAVRRDDAPRWVESWWDV